MIATAGCTRHHAQVGDGFNGKFHWVMGNLYSIASILNRGGQCGRKFMRANIFFGAEGFFYGFRCARMYLQCMRLGLGRV